MLWALIAFFVNLIVLTLILHVIGLRVVGGERAKISKAFTIAFLGAFVYFVLTILFIFVPLSLSWEYAFVFRTFLSFVIWFVLIKSLYKTRLTGAIAVAVLVLIMVLLELVVKDFLVTLKLLV